MSEILLRLIPTDPQFVPAVMDQEAAQEALRRLLTGADDVSVSTTTDPAFVDPGANLERVNCPVCGAPVDLEWWLPA